MANLRSRSGEINTRFSEATLIGEQPVKSCSNSRIPAIRHSVKPCRNSAPSDSSVDPSSVSYEEKPCRISARMSSGSSSPDQQSGWISRFPELPFKLSPKKSRSISPESYNIIERSKPGHQGSADDEVKRGRSQDDLPEPNNKLRSSKSDSWLSKLPPAKDKHTYILLFRPGFEHNLDFIASNNRPLMHKLIYTASDGQWDSVFDPLEIEIIGFYLLKKTYLTRSIIDKIKESNAIMKIPRDDPDLVSLGPINFIKEFCILLEIVVPDNHRWRVINGYLGFETVIFINETTEIIQ